MMIGDQIISRDRDLGRIGAGHVCKHGIRWPHPCDPCDRDAETIQFMQMAPEREQLALTIAEAMWGQECAELYARSGRTGMPDTRWGDALRAADAVMSRYACPVPQRPSRLYRDAERYAFLEPR